MEAGNIPSDRALKVQPAGVAASTYALCSPAKIVACVLDGAGRAPDCFFTGLKVRGQLNHRKSGHSHAAAGNAPAAIYYLEAHAVGNAVALVLMHLGQDLSLVTVCDRAPGINADPVENIQGMELSLSNQ